MIGDWQIDGQVREFAGEDIYGRDVKVVISLTKFKRSNYVHKT
jgi:hypothetical protein